MKKLIFALIIIHCSFQIAIGQWVQKSTGMNINKIVWSLAVSGNNIFAGTNAGVYLSTNNGEFWSLTSLNNQSGNVLLINGNNIYAGTYNGIFLSSNNGQNWMQIGINNRSVWALAINASNIFAGTDFGYGVYRSTDYGMNWTQTSLNNKIISSIVISGNNIFAGDWASSSVYRSTDNGNNWAQIFLGGSPTEVVLCLAVNGNNFFAGTGNGGIFRSTNNGLNWANTSLNNVSVLSLTLNCNYIFAGTAIWSNGGVYFSSDNGNNWFLKKQGMSNLSVWSLATTNQYIFAGTDSSVWRRNLSDIIGVQNISTETPSKYSLLQNYPNPFNPSTKIRFDVPGVGARHALHLHIFDITGREVQTLVNEKLSPGTYEVEWNASNFASGIYFYQLKSEDYIATKKLILIK